MLQIELMHAKLRWAKTMIDTLDIELAMDMIMNHGDVFCLSS